MLNFLQTLPKDVLIGGTPCTLDSVPLFAKRQVIFNCEMLHQDDDVVREALNAYYAADPWQVIDFCQAYGVDYLVVDAQTYTQAYIDAGDMFFDPYNQELLPLIRSRDTFTLENVPDEAKVFQSGDLFVVPCTGAALRDSSRLLPTFGLNGLLCRSNNLEIEAQQDDPHYPTELWSRSATNRRTVTLVDNDQHIRVSSTEYRYMRQSDVSGTYLCKIEMLAKIALQDQRQMLELMGLRAQRR
jgi:hypothetical protein